MCVWCLIGPYFGAGHVLVRRLLCIWFGAFVVFALCLRGACLVLVSCLVVCLIGVCLLLV